MLRFFRQVTVARILLSYLVGLLIPLRTELFPVSLLLWAVFGLGMHRYVSTRLPSGWSIRWIPGLCFLLLWMAMGNWNMSRILRNAEFPEPESRFVAEVRLLDHPTKNKKSQSVPIRIEAVDSGYEKWQGKSLLVYLASGWEVVSPEINDRLLLQLSPSPALSPAYPGAFDQVSWLRKKGICGTAYAGEGQGRILHKGFAYHPRVVAKKISDYLIDRFRLAGLKDQKLALVSALVLGERSGLDAETTNAFSSTGISHILSVSGLHVAVLYGVLSFLLGVLDPKSRLNVFRQLILIGFLIFYAFITGLSPSVCRSVFMFSMLAFGKCLNRKSLSINTVLFSAWVLLLINPGFIFDLGFQLSYLAVVSLIVLYPLVLDLWKPKILPVQRIWEMACLSLVAQLGTAPLTIHVFHAFPSYFLLNNLIAVPFSSLLLYFAGSYLALGWIPGFGGWLANTLGYLLDFFLQLTQKAADLPYALLDRLHIGVVEVFFLYALLVCISVCFLGKRRHLFIPSLVVGLMCQVVFLLNSFGF